MFGTPISVILSWPAPNYTDPVRRSPVTLTLPGAIFLFLATVCVLVRLRTRIYVRSWLGLDDVFILLAWLCNIAVAAMATYGSTHLNWDRHGWDFHIQLFSMSGKFMYSLRLLWRFSSSFVRLSVLCLYYRLIRATHAPPYFFWILHAVTAYNLLLFLFYIVLGVFPCMYYWTFPGISPEHCINDGLVMEVTAVVNTCAEFMLAILPTVAIFYLRVSKRQRWSVISILSLGFLVGFVGCFRTYYIFKMWTTYDLAWWSGPQWICSEAEIDLAIICACAPALRPVLGRLVGRLRRTIHPQMPPRQSKLDSDLDTANQNSLRAEDVSNWTEMMLSFDLEGIATDGYGYTVAITGPVASRRGNRKDWFRAATKMNFLDPRSKRTCPAPYAMRPLEIPIKTEVAVVEGPRAMMPLDMDDLGQTHSKGAKTGVDEFGIVYPNNSSETADVYEIPVEALPPRRPSSAALPR